MLISGFSGESMNIIAIMGPHGVYYKDEPIKELERALQSLDFKLSGRKIALTC